MKMRRLFIVMAVLGAGLVSTGVRGEDVLSGLDATSGIFDSFSGDALATHPPFSLSALAVADSGADSSDDKPRNYLGLKLGAFWGTDDLHDVDEVFYSELVFGRYIIGRLLSIEANVGFAYDDDDIGPVDVEVFALPFFLNARLSLPVTFLEPYVGAGFGGFYVHGELDGPAGFDRKDDDVVFAGNAFAGLNVSLGTRMYVSGEVKYYVTDKTDVGVDFDGVVAMAGIGFRL